MISGTMSMHFSRDVHHQVSAMSSLGGLTHALDVLSVTLALKRHVWTDLLSIATNVSPKLPTVGETIPLNLYG